MRQQEQTSWRYEYGVRRADGSIRVAAGGNSWTPSQAQAWADSYNEASRRLDQPEGAKVIRRKVYTTTIVRKEPWERV